MNKYFGYVLAASAKMLNFVALSLISIVLTNQYGLAGYGKYAYYISLMTILFVPFSSTAIQWTTRAVASKKKISTFKNATIIYAISIILIVALLNTFDVARVELLVAILIGGALSLLNIQVGIFRGLGKSNLSIYIEVLGKSVLPLVFFYCLTLFKYSHNLGIVLLVQLIAVIIVIIMSTVSRSVKNSNPTSNREDDFKLTTYASTVAATCIPLVVVELIILIIGKKLSFEEAGAFRIGLIISSATVFTLTLVNAKEAYKFAELRAKAAMKRWRLYVRFTKLSAVASLPIFIFLFFFIDDLVLRIWGEKLLVYVESMRVILVAGMLNVAFGPIGMVLIMSHKERILIYSGIISISPIVIAYIIELGYNGIHTMSMLYLLHVFLLNTAMLIMSIKEGVMRVDI